MKTAVSIPTDVFRRADRLARHLGTSRSALYAAALRAYVVRHDDDALRAAVNRVCERTDTGLDPRWVDHLRLRWPKETW
jgi:metal-responsive CopG/Arc/MetJ family transcriptional regulator